MGDLIGLLFGPQWFYKESLGIDLISAAVLVSTAIASYRYSHHTNKKRNYKRLTWAFIFIATAFVIKAVLGLLAEFRVVSPESPIVALLGTIIGMPGGIGTLTAFIAYHALMLLGFYVMYCIYCEPGKTDMILWIYFLGVVVFASIGANFIFHLTIVLLLSVIVYKYYQRYKKNKNNITRLLAIGFGIIATSHFLFIFKYYVEFYLAAELLQLIGYLTLLIVLILVRKHGKKTITNRHHT